MDNIVSFIKDNLVVFDIAFLIFVTYFAIQCLTRGFVLSIISSVKWILALVITIKLIPIVESRVSDYIDINERVFSVGLGIFVYAISLFVLIIIGRSLGRVSYAGLGPIDKIFGLFFGIAKGYIFAVCIFSIVSWFYSYEKWDISLNDSYFFPKVEWGSMWLIDKFPDQIDFENTKEKIEEI
mgnify:FL=1|tara:strand:+ start:604 stop:1149 length:546 start_codon:yes stop_codon:yes gene_type:complete